jgi:hypothetical protein
MKGRPAKSADEKFSKRIPFVAPTASWEQYEAARMDAGYTHLSEWIRATLDAEVSRLRKKRQGKS